MELDFAMLADDATAHSGKLYVHGGLLTQISVPQLPWLANFAIAGRLMGDDDEAGEQYRIDVRIWQPDGQPAFPIPPIEFVLGSEYRNAEQPGYSVVLSLKVPAIALRETGWYLVELALDGQVLAQMPFRVSIPALGRR